MQFSGVSIATSGAVNVWLNKTIGSPVELMMLYRNIDNQYIECIVHIWRRWFHYVCVYVCNMFPHLNFVTFINNHDAFIITMSNTITVDMENSV